MTLQWEPTGPTRSTWDSLVHEIVRRDPALICAHLPELMVWLQDLNWPGAQHIADFLMALGAPVLPHTRTILQGTGREGQYGFLDQLIDRWPRELVVPLAPDLLALASLDTHVEADVMALAQLRKHRLGDPGVIRHLVEHKKAVYQTRPSLLDGLEETRPSTP